MIDLNVLPEEIGTALGSRMFVGDVMETETDSVILRVPMRQLPRALQIVRGWSSPERCVEVDITTRAYHARKNIQVPGWPRGIKVPTSVRRSFMSNDDKMAEELEGVLARLRFDRRRVHTANLGRGYRPDDVMMRVSWRQDQKGDI